VSDGARPLDVSSAWATAYPGAVAGVLLMRGVANPERHPELDRRRVDLEERLRARFARADRAALAAVPSLQPYAAYYGRYRKTYHVLLQLESVLLKGRPLAPRPALVEAMFLAEMEHQLLTAGHDYEAIRGAITLGVARGDETYTLLDGRPQTLKAGDMTMADADGIISSVVYGPDHRTRIIPHTRRVLFAVYGPPGVEAVAVRRHLETLRANVRAITPSAEVEALDVHVAGSEG
jgi:DNA/RNA-binding domain of Phe-tRNA-synthetase-like protein